MGLMDFSFNTYLKTAPPTIILKPDIPVFTILFANSAYLEATNSRLESLVGRSFLDVFPASPSDLISKSVNTLINSITEAVLTRRLQILPNQKYGIPVWGTERFNTRYWRATSSPILNEEGEVECIVLVTQDVTGSVAEALKERFVFEVADEMRKSIEQIEERLRLAIDSAEMGTWYMDIITKEFMASPRMKILFGYRADEDMSYDQAIAQILPEYRGMVSRAADAALAGSVPYHVEYPVMGYHDKTVRWVRATGKKYQTNANGIAHFSGTIMDITERKLEELRKNDFLSIASHELKTPLTSLKASLQLLNRIKYKPATAILPKLIDQCNKSMDRISALVNDLLNAGKITEGKIVLNYSVFSFAELISGCCDHVTSEGIYQLIAEGDVNLKLRADEQHIDRVLVNLVNNAIKYAQGSFKIIIRIEAAYPMAKISVQDFGRGISKNHLEQLFQRYYRANVTDMQNSGLGLGLYISAEIVKKHGGQIGVESEEGKGSTFWFTIPLAEYPTG